MAKAMKAGLRTAAPQHPGEVLAGILEENRVSIRAAATAIGVSHNALTKVVNGQSPVTPEMAARLGAYIGNGTEVWLTMQRDYDVWRVEREMAADLKRIVPMAQ